MLSEGVVNGILTGDGRGLGEVVEDLRVDVDGQLLLLDEPLVARLDDGLGPVGEGLADERVGEVDEPLSRQLAELLLVGEVVGTHFVAQRLLKDLLDAEACVLRQGQVANTVVAHELLGALDDGLEVVDGVALVGREVGVAVDGEEGVPTELVSDGKSTYTSRLDRYLIANICAVTCWRWPRSLFSCMLLVTLIIVTLL